MRPFYYGHEEKSMPAYFIASIQIEDRERYATYEAGFLEVFARYGGELVAVSDEPTVVEGGWPYTRSVLLRFENAKQARRWYDSADYQALAEHRKAASTGSLILVEGLS